MPEQVLVNNKHEYLNVESSPRFNVAPITDSGELRLILSLPALLRAFPCSLSSNPADIRYRPPRLSMIVLVISLGTTIGSGIQSHLVPTD